MADMSAQPAETEKTDDFSGTRVLLGIIIAFGMTFGWGALMDALQVPHLPYTENPSLQIRLLSLLHTSLTLGFVYGAMSIAQFKIRASFPKLIGLTVFWSFVGGLLSYSLSASHIILETLFGKVVGDIIGLTIFAGIAAFVVASAKIATRQLQVKSIGFKEYLNALLRLGKSATLRLLTWTIYGAAIGLLIGLTLNHVMNFGLFALLIFLNLAWGVWLGKPAIVFDASRRNNAIRSVLSVVAIVGPILLMTFNVQFGLMVLVVVILLYAVITLRK